MNFEDLKNLADKNEVRVDDHKGHKIRPPHYYLLQEAFEYYFKTFNTVNSGYDFYILATSTDKRKALRILEHQFINIHNTVLCIILFERFFELFLKDLLSKTNCKLTNSVDRTGYSNSHLRMPTDTITLINQIVSNVFIPYKEDNKRLHQIPFKVTIKRFYDLVDYSGDVNYINNRIVKKFSKTLEEFSFLKNSDYKETFKFLNWYRDRILHKGSKLPRLRFLDDIVIHRIIPIIKEIIKADTRIPEEWKYFTKTESGIDILEEMCKIKFGLRKSNNPQKIKEEFDALLLIGHLKELGRANMKMNNNMRNNRSTNEYNYHDSKGRGQRFAVAEKKQYPNSKLAKCPCCNENSLVLYEKMTTKYPNADSEAIKIQWVTCYVCGYHLRNNTFDLHYFNNNFEKLFD